MECGICDIEFVAAAGYLRHFHISESVKTDRVEERCWTQGGSYSISEMCPDFALWLCA